MELVQGRALLWGWNVKMTSNTQETGSGGVLYYLSQQVTRQGQGGYAHVNEIIAGLSRRGWQVRLFQPSYAQRAQNPSLMMRLPAMVKAEIDLIFARPEPDAVYLRSHLVSNLVARWCVWRRIPYVEEVNSAGTDAGKVYPVLRRVRGVSRRAAVWRWRHAAAIIVVTPVLREIVLSAVPGANVEVVPTGANTTLFHAPVDQTRPIEGSYVLFFGSLAPWHDLATMLAAVELASWPAGVRLVILGSGQQAESVKEAAEHDPRIVYVPGVPYSEVPVWVGHALAGLSLLRTGNGLSASPLKLYETMACSVPVIVSEAPGQADLVREIESGVVIPESNPGALAAAVAMLWENPDEAARMGERGRRAVELSHSWDIRSEQTHRILLNVLRTSARQRLHPPSAMDQGGRSTSW